MQLKKQPLTVRIAMWSAKNRWLVAASWFILTIGIFIYGELVLGTRTDNISTNQGPSNLESTRAWEIFDADGKNEGTDSVVLVISHPTLKITDQSYKDAIGKVATNLRELNYGAENKLVFARVNDKISTPFDFGQLASADNTTSRVVATITGNDKERKEKLKAALPKLDSIKNAPKEIEPNFKTFVLNNDVLSDQVNEVIQHDLDGTLKITLPLTFIILLLAFGAVVAAVIPLILGITSLLAAFGLMAIYSHLVGPIDPNVSQVIVLIGLAVGIDYSLFLITRYRAERRRGRDKLHAIEVASSTAGRAVFFSGVTVMISLGGLFMVGDSLFTSMAIGSIAVVAAAVVGSLTFLPATLSILGNGVNALRLPYFGRDKEEGSGIWAKLVGIVMQRPLVFMLSTLVLLTVLSLPLFHIRLGNNSLDGLPDSIEGVKALRLMNEKWPQGLTLKLNVIVPEADKPETKAKIEKFNQAALSVAGLKSPPEVTMSKNGHVAALAFTIAGSRNDKANQDIVVKLRNEVVPANFGAGKAFVTGSAAYTLDAVNYFAEKLPLVFGFVLGLSFLLLLIAFHSLVIPIKAIILNLFSTGASYGVMVWVFQDGYLSEQIGFRPTGVIESFIPLFMFTILFGLSMDYHLFILTRIKESKDRGLASNEAVARGISVTSGTITSAAAIMVVVFGVFVTLQIMIIRQLGLGLAVAVFIDATLIRCVLLPATMRLLGEWNWWMPKFLDWIPQVTIEGEEEEETSKPAQPENKENVLVEAAGD